MCAFVGSDGSPLLAFGTRPASGVSRDSRSDMTPVQVQDPVTGTIKAVLKGHTGTVTAICAYTDPRGRRLLATGSSTDHNVRIWNPSTLSAAHEAARLLRWAC